MSDNTVFSRRELFRGGSRLVTVGALTMGVGGLLSGCGGGSKLSGLVLDPPPNIGGITLPDVTDGGEKPTPLKADPGRWLLLYLGYTHCPDVCPTSMVDLRDALQKVGNNAKRFTLGFITMDPTRDEPTRLAQYVNQFIPNSRAFRTLDDAQLKKFTNAVGGYYNITPPAEPGKEPIVAHSAQIYAVDAKGLVQVQWAYKTPVDTLTRDLKILAGRQSKP